MLLSSVKGEEVEVGKEALVEDKDALVEDEDEGGGGHSGSFEVAK